LDRFDIFFWNIRLKSSLSKDILLASQMKIHGKENNRIVLQNASGFR